MNNSTPESAQIELEEEPVPVVEGQGEEGRMEQIRSLLFGSQMRDYDRRFSDLSDRHRDDLERLRQEQNSRFSKLETFMRSELERLGNQQREVRQEDLSAQSALGDRLEALERSLRERLDKIDERLSEEALELRGELREQTGEQLDALHQARNELTDSLERERLRLQDEKTGREELAQLFTEVALRLNREFELPEA